MGEIKLSTIKMNPNNPRVIKDEKFQKLVKSIEEFPKMMALRPMVVNEDNIVLGGNMRLKALKQLGYKSIPESWVRKANELTAEEQRRFVIADNVGFGEHDWELLRAEWDLEELEDWGVDVPEFIDNEQEEEEKLNIEDLFDIQLPFYTPSDIEPNINELADLCKTKELIKKIERLDIDLNLKEILKVRASFFTDFNFQKIADFYSKQNDEVKEVFKSLGMVILAPKEALKKGFIDLKENVV